jgi:hypothetical protein
MKKTPILKRIRESRFVLEQPLPYGLPGFKVI